MNLSYRSKLFLSMAGLVSIGLVSAVSSFVLAYSQEKLGEAFERELANSVHTASRLEALSRYLPTMTEEETKGSTEIVFVADRFCDPEASVVYSAHYRTMLEDTGLEVSDVLRSEPIRRYCESSESLLSPSFRFFPPTKKFLFPYVLAAVSLGASRKLAMLSLDDLSAGTGVEGFLLANSTGETIWSSFEAGEMEELLARTAIPREALREYAERTTKSSLPGLVRVGEGFLSYAPILSRSVLFTIGADASVLGGVRLMWEQASLLLIAFLCLCVIISRRMALRLSRPLSRLSSASKEVGSGNFDVQVRVEGDPEFRVVQQTFNQMAERLSSLIQVAKQSSRMEAELDLAQKTQQMLFPPPRVTYGDHELLSVVKNAEKCGGDWWGSFEARNSRDEAVIVVLIGDVTGHGAPSALLTAACQGGLAILKAWAASHPSVLDDPREILRLFNRSVFYSSQGMLSMSFFAAILRPASDTMEVANAGHNRPYIIRKQEDSSISVKPIGTASPVLGNDLQQEYKDTETFPWKPGDKLFLYTDGLIECYQEEKNLFDRRQMLRILKEKGDEPATLLLEHLMRERETQISGLPPQDDVTVVVCTREKR